MTLMPADNLQEMITDHTVDFDFILIDVRDDFEVESGIIASRYCKPYHMSWNDGNLQQWYSQLPQDMPLVVYCRSGNRSLEAANFLVEKGFTQVASVAQGINSYKGALSDSTELKPLSALPEPSYLGDTTTSVLRIPRKQHAIIITVPERSRRQFNLQGCSLPQRTLLHGAPVYILERIGEKSSGSLRGIRKQHSKP